MPSHVQRKNISTENGRKKIVDAAEQKKDIVFARIKSLEDGVNFVYHMTNDCYKRYTIKELNKTSLGITNKNVIWNCNIHFKLAHIPFIRSSIEETIS